MTRSLFMKRSLFAVGSAAVTLSLLAGLDAIAQHQRSTETAANRPWMDASLPPERRAELVLRQMTLDEKIGLLHGEGKLDW